MISGDSCSFVGRRSEHSGMFGKRHIFTLHTMMASLEAVYLIPSWINNLKPYETSSRKYQLKLYSRNFFSTNFSSSLKKKKMNIGKSVDYALIFSKIQEKRHTAHERYPKLTNSFAAHILL